MLTDRQFLGLLDIIWSRYTTDHMLRVLRRKGLVRKHSYSLTDEGWQALRIPKEA